MFFFFLQAKCKNRSDKLHGQAAPCTKEQVLPKFTSRGGIRPSVNKKSCAPSIIAGTCWFRCQRNVFCHNSFKCLVSKQKKVVFFSPLWKHTCNKEKHKPTTDLLLNYWEIFKVLLKGLYRKYPWNTEINYLLPVPGMQ